MTDHPITPLHELIYQWKSSYLDAKRSLADLLTEAYQTGADQELEACCEWLEQLQPQGGVLVERLHAARRPQPLSLKEMCLMHLSVMERDGHYIPEILGDLRRALEQIDD